jgi:hypothetical protein
MQIFRKLRGIAATALTWAVVWAPLSLIPLGLRVLLLGPVPSGMWGNVWRISMMTGAINGAIFGTVLAIAGQRKTFETLSLRWIAACGAAGGALFPLALRAVGYAMLDLPIPATALASTLVTNALLGAGLATSTLAVARHAPALPRETVAARPGLETGTV